MSKSCDLSILIPARNEMFLQKTIESILDNATGNTEVIAVLDGYWPNPGIPDHPRVTLVHVTESIGQRAATNMAARISRAKFIAKCDAHCSFAKGFDETLMAECEYDWTVIPRMYNLHAFNWTCVACGEVRYQGPSGLCVKCNGETVMEMVWQPRLRCRSDFMRFDKNLRFAYWSELERRPESKGEIAETLSLLGAFWMMHRKRYEDLEGLDENHGSWGQMGTEVSLKTWLSGGRLVVNKKTWFSHMFRTQGGDFGFPYPISGNEQERARKYSQDLWLNNRWKKQVRPLEWLVEHFKPVPDWH